MTNENSSIAYPKWVNIYLWATTIMATMFSLLAYFKPEIQFGTWEPLSAAGALSLAGPLGLYIARNLATAVCGFFALSQRSLPMVKMLVVLRLVTDGLDFAHNAFMGNMQGGAFAAIMFAIEAYIMIALSKR